MKKSYHSIVVPMALASATRRASALRSFVDRIMRAKSRFHSFRNYNLSRQQPFVQAVFPGIHRESACRHAKTAADLIVNMDFCGFARCFPRREERQTAISDIKMRGADSNEQWRSMPGYADILQRGSVNRHQKVRRCVR